MSTKITWYTSSFMKLHLLDSVGWQEIKCRLHFCKTEQQIMGQVEFPDRWASPKPIQRTETQFGGGKKTKTLTESRFLQPANCTLSNQFPRFQQ